jgi:predicted MFS family arabinose efflux permease
VWGATVGAVVGPNLVAPAATVATSLGLPELAGAYLVPIVFVGTATILTLVALRPDPYELADTSSRHDHPEGERSTAVSLRTVLRRPNVPVAMVSLVTVQVVMVLIMTMTPLHMTEHGHGLGAVGIVISGHTFGMFGLSPISGRLTDRYGSVPVILAGLVTLAGASILAAAAPPDGGAPLFIALFLLGYGWNLCFVGGSGRLARDLPEPARAGVEGAVDATVWGVAALASLVSTPVLSAGGYAALAWAAAACALAPTAFLLTAETR